MGTHPLHTEEWFEKSLKIGWMEQTISSLAPLAKFILVVILPVLVITGVMWLMQGWMWGIAWMVCAFLILGYSIGISRLDTDIAEHLSSLRKLDTEIDPDKVVEHHQLVMQSLVHDEFSKVYPVLFWFWAIGPVGALLYRLTMQFQNSANLTEGDRKFAARILHALDWIPVRITGLAFSVVGNFVYCTRRLVDSLFDWSTPAVALLCSMAELSVMADESSPATAQDFIRKAEVQTIAVQNLLHRSLLFWIALLAVLTVLGWG
jgi:AmpE protein